METFLICMVCTGCAEISDAWLQAAGHGDFYKEHDEMYRNQHHHLTPGGPAVPGPAPGTSCA